VTGLTANKYYYPFRCGIITIFLLCIAQLWTFSQTCSTFQISKAFLFDGYGYGNIFQQKSNGEFLFGGLNNYKLTLGNADHNGNLLWTKRYDISNNLFYTDKTSGVIDLNGNYFVGLPNDCVAILDPAGNPIITKKLDIPNQEVGVLSLGILPNNNKIVLVKDYSTYGGDGYMVLRLSADLSTIIWNKHISAWDTYFNAIIIDSNKVIIPGSTGISGIGVLLCLDASNGNTIVNKSIIIDNKRTHLDMVYEYSSGYVIKARYFGGETNNHLYIRVDNNFNIINSYRFATIFDNAGVVFAAERDGSFYGAWSTGGGFGHYKFYMTKNDSVLWNRLSLASGLTGPVSLNITSEGLLMQGSGNFFEVATQTARSHIVITRSDENGIFQNCYTTDLPFNIIPIANTSGTSPLIPRDTNMISLASETLVVTANNYQLFTSCQAVSLCDSLQIIGDSSYCNRDSIIFIARRNPGCFKPVQWTVAGGNIATQKLSDSTLLVTFPQSGNYRLIASLDSLCLDIADTLDFTITLNSLVLDLGPDSTICSNNTLLLNAHAGYTSYLWQDGTTDSTFVVTAPGQYWVQALDGCNNLYKDTIVISDAPPILFDIGPDLTKCNTDSVSISAPAGFLNYTWGPAYNISSTSGQNVFVFPTVDTIYSVTAEKTPGCFAHDTIQINVNMSAPIYLGADTSFCAGNSIALNAGNGFMNYSWSTGQTTPSINVTSTGVYSVIATDNNNCASKDTLKVINVFNNPVVGLPKDSLLCTGTIKLLNAVNGMNSYSWSTGATSSNISVNSVGTYWVNVIDNNGCRGTDTAKITRVLSLPAAFLPADTVLCSYSILKISPIQNYSSYVWNTGSSQSSLTVSQAGIYWLRVTDNFNCVGTDSIIVKPKQCLEGIFVPNAFTPNKDGKNDIFRPLLFGIVSNMKFVIYNKWGQKVYDTSNLYEGWDGKVNSKDAKADVFVWTCEYQFEGKEKKFAKGTVLLIR